MTRRGGDSTDGAGLPQDRTSKGRRGPALRSSPCHPGVGIFLAALRSPSTIAIFACTRVPLRGFSIRKGHPLIVLSQSLEMTSRQSPDGYYYVYGYTTHAAATLAWLIHDWSDGES